MLKSSLLVATKEESYHLYKAYRLSLKRPNSFLITRETLNLALVNGSWFVPSVKVKERGWISDGVFAASSPFSSSSVLCCVDSGSSEGVRGYKMLPDMISPPNRFWRFTTAVGSSDTRPRPPFCSLSTRISLILCPHVFLASVRGA